MPSQKDGQPVEPFRTGQEVTVFLWLLLGITEGRDPARNDGDFVHRVGLFHRFGRNGMSRFVKGDDFFFLRIHHPVLFLKTSRPPVDGCVEILPKYRLYPPTSPGESSRQARSTLLPMVPNRSSISFLSGDQSDGHSVSSC